MDGPMHYREAERLVADATTLFQGPDYRAERVERLTLAQVHATLALVAAMAGAHDPHGLDVPDWAAVLETGA